MCVCVVITVSKSIHLEPHQNWERFARKPAFACATPIRHLGRIHDSVHDSGQWQRGFSLRVWVKSTQWSNDWTCALCVPAIKSMIGALHFGTCTRKSKVRIVHALNYRWPPMARCLYGAIQWSLSNLPQKIRKNEVCRTILRNAAQLHCKKQHQTKPV